MSLSTKSDKIIFMNNADLGMTLQSRICTIYNLSPCKRAKEQFNSNYNKEFEAKVDPVVFNIFKELKLKPVKCTTLESSDKKGESIIPYNFVLENGKTLSIRTSKTNKMIAPRVVGQAGFNVLNMFFEDIIGEHLYTQEQIRKAVYKNINEMLPVFVNYLLNSDYTIWIYPKDDGFDYLIVDNNTAVDIEYSKTNFSFTKPLKDWTESITLKYKGLSIAEIQTHKNRTFKFRFNFPNLINLFVEERNNTETIGISAEYAICKKFDLEYPSNFETRKSDKIVLKICDVVDKAFLQLPKAIKHTGSDSGVRLGSSRCPYDFILEGNKTLSLKTNIGKMVCPPEVGQPSNSTFDLYFKDILEGDLVDEVIFKNLVLNSADKMLPIYTEHLFDSDYLLWIYNRDGKWDFKILEKDAGKNVIWVKDEISFTKPTVEDWNESNTMKYKGKRIGEFQYHHHRNCYKFRFDFENLINLINEVIENKSEED